MTDAEHIKLWESMAARSFDPREWFVRDDTPPTREGTIMWVYRRTEANLWTVGYFTPQGSWETDGDYKSREEAAARVRWLNGGQTTGAGPVGPSPRTGAGPVPDAARRGFGTIRESA